MYDDKLDYNDFDSMYPKKKTDSPLHLIAGILLIISGILAILFSIQLIVIDVSVLEQIVDISQFQQINPSLTIEDIKLFYSYCATAEIIFTVFAFIGGILSITKKLWGICLGFAIITSIAFIVLIIPGIFSIIALVLLILAKKEFE